MATLSAVRAGLKTRVTTITALAQRTWDHWPDQFTPPGAIVRVVSGNYEQTLGGNDAIVRFEIFIAVQVGTLETAQDQLDPYLDNAGASSIKAAIEADSTLGGVVSYSLVRGFRDYDILEINGVEYLGAIVEVDCYLE